MNTLKGFFCYPSTNCSFSLKWTGNCSGKEVIHNNTPKEGRNEDNFESWEVKRLKEQEWENKTKSKMRESFHCVCVLIRQVVLHLPDCHFDQDEEKRWFSSAVHNGAQIFISKEGERPLPLTTLSFFSLYFGEDHLIATIIFLFSVLTAVENNRFAINLDEHNYELLPSQTGFLSWGVKSNKHLKEGNERSNTRFPSLRFFFQLLWSYYCCFCWLHFKFYQLRKMRKMGKGKRGTFSHILRLIKEQEERITCSH